MQLPLQQYWSTLVNPQLFSESLLDLKLVLLVALEGLLYFLVLLKPNYFNGVTRQIITTRIMSKICLSSKHGSVSSPREAELQSPLPGNDANLLSLQENPIGCSSRMSGNLKCFQGFLIWIKSVELYNLSTLKTCIKLTRLQGFQLQLFRNLTIRCRDGELTRMADLHTKHMHING